VPFPAHDGPLASGVMTSLCLGSVMANCFDLSWERGGPLTFSQCCDHAHCNCWFVYVVPRRTDSLVGASGTLASASVTLCCSELIVAAVAGGCADSASASSAACACATSSAAAATAVVAATVASPRSLHSRILILLAFFDLAERFGPGRAGRAMGSRGLRTLSLCVTCGGLGRSFTRLE